VTREIFTPHGGSIVAGIGPYAVPHPYAAGSLAVFTDQGGQLVPLAAEDWSVMPAETAVSGNVYLTAQAAVREAGRTLFIRRATVPQQGWQGVLGEREAGLEAQLDLLTMVVQDASHDSATAIRLAEGSNTPVSPRALTVLAFDAARKLVLLDQASFTTGAGVLLLPSGIPTGALGKDGDLCIVAATGDLYGRAAGVWTLQGNLAGPPGPPLNTSPFIATLLDDIDQAAARDTLGLSIGTAVQAYAAALSQIAGITGAEGTLAARNADGFWVALPPPAAGSYLRRNAAGDGWEGGVPPSGGWEPWNGTDGIFYDHAVHGPVANFVGPTYADDHDYLFLFEELSPSYNDVTLRHEFFLASFATYGTPTPISAAAQSTQIVSGHLELFQPHASRKDAAFSIRTFVNTANSGGNMTMLNNATGGHRSTTAQPRVHSRFSWSAGNNDAGKAFCFSRRSNWQ
jgi:hypothetical protein